MTLNQAISYTKTALQIALMIIFAATLLKMFGVRIPISTLQPTQLAYLCGAWWLLAKTH